MICHKFILVRIIQLSLCLKYPTLSTWELRLIVSLKAAKVDLLGLTSLNGRFYSTGIVFHKMLSKFLVTFAIDKRTERKVEEGTVCTEICLHG